MKKIYLLKVMFFAFLAFQFISCENEPLSGEFPQEDENNAEIGQFKAIVEGVQFVASETSATLSTTNDLVLTGIKAGGEKISLSVRNATVGTYDLGVNLNLGAYFDTSINTFPYVSTEAVGGSGQMVISEIDSVDLTITGTFKFTGYRMKLDGNGEIVLDVDGNPVLEDIEITKGSFNAIPYIVDDSGNNGGNSMNEFFAKVDGVGFLADSISISEPIIGNINMLKIEASNIQGKLMRIDIPKYLGLGTFDMVNISDGTKLIALYNAGGAGENLTSNPGTITITEVDYEEGILKATFAFTGNDPLGQVPDQVQVTEGKFTAHFEGVPGGNNIFKALVNGVAYNPNPSEIVITTAVVNQYPTITISTTKGDQKMELTFPATITEGVFNMGTEVIDGDEIVGSYTPFASTSITYISSPGTLRITNYDLVNRIIEGNFSFKAIDITGVEPNTFAISAGSFYIELP